MTPDATPPSTQGAPTLPLSHSNSPYCGGGACTRVHLRSLRGEDVHIENLAIGVEELAQLLVAAAGRDAADEELVLGVGDATVARVHRRVGEAHLQRVAQGRQGTLIVQRVDGRLRRDEGRVLHEAAALVHVGATIAQDDDLDDLAILREDCGRECGPHQGGQRRQGEKRWGGRASAAKGVQPGGCVCARSAPCIPWPQGRRTGRASCAEHAPTGVRCAPRPRARPKRCVRLRRTLANTVLL